jgi:hypothetical protein
MNSRVVLIRRIAPPKVTIVGLNPDEEDHVYDAIDHKAREYGYDTESTVSSLGQPFTIWLTASGKQSDLQGQLFEWVFEECQCMDYVVEHD